MKVTKNARPAIIFFASMEKRLGGFVLTRFASHDFANLPVQGALCYINGFDIFIIIVGRR